MNLIELDRRLHQLRLGSTVDTLETRLLPGADTEYGTHLERE
jgi:hypothetical protein